MQINSTRPVTTAIGVEIPDPIRRQVTQSHDICPGSTITEWLDESGLGEKLAEVPTLVMHNGVPLLEEEWSTTTINAGDVVTLAGQPGIPIAIVWVGWAITAAVTAYSLYLALTLDTSLDDNSDASPNYSISYRGNKARPGAPKRVCYGTSQVYPDIGAQSYTVFAADQQQLYQLFEFTEGEADIAIATMQYAETPLTNFADYDVEVCQPGVPSKLFPQTVYNVPAVSNIELTTDWTPEYRVCEQGDEVGSVFIDFVCPEGMYQVNSAGSYKYMQVLVLINWRLFDESDAGWTEEGHMFTESWHPIRRTIRIPFFTTGSRAPGDYKFRFKRTIADTQSSRVMETVQLTGLRGFIPNAHTPDSTRVALYIRTTDQIGDAALSKFNALVKRKLPVYDGSSWSAPVQTDNAVWAFVDALRADYGGKRDDAYIDLDYLTTLAGTNTLPFNGCFDSVGTLKPVLDEIAGCMLGRAVELPGNVYTIKLDEAGTPPSALFTSASILEDSFSFELIYPGSETNDSVAVTFKHAADGYRDGRIVCVPSGSAGTNPKEVTLRGPTHVYHAALMGYRMAGESRYRRTMVSFEVGTEGYLASFGEVVRVQDFGVSRLGASNAVAGELLSYNSGNGKIVAHCDVADGVTAGFVYIMNNAGAPIGPITATANGNVVTLQSGFDDSGLTFDDDQQLPQFVFGEVDDFTLDIKVTEVNWTPGSSSYQIKGFIDDQDAYTSYADPTPDPISPPQDQWPVVSNVLAYMYGDTSNPYVRLSWTGDNSDHYRIAVTTDAGVTWGVVETRVVGNTYTCVPPLEPAVQYAVAGISAFPGYPAFSNIISPTGYVLSIPAVTGLVQVGDLSDKMSIQWDQPVAGYHVLIDVQWNGASKRWRIYGRDTTTFSYSFSDAIEDEPSYFFGTPVATHGCRTVTFRLALIAVDGSLGDVPAVLTMTNPQVGAIEGLTYTERGSSLNLNYQMPDARDFAGIWVYISQQQGFTPGPENWVRVSNSTDVNIDILEPNSTYYMRVAGSDHWGYEDLNFSSEVLINTGDDILGGDVPWGSIVGDDKPEDRATATGIASAVLDPRFDLSAAQGALTGYWGTEGSGVALSSSSGYDSGPGVTMTASGTVTRLFPSHNRLPGSLGARFQVTLQVSRSSGMTGYLEASEYDRSGNLIDRHYPKVFTTVTANTWTVVNEVHTVQSNDCRYVQIALLVNWDATIGQTLKADNFDVYLLPPLISSINSGEYIADGSLDTRSFVPGSVFISQTVTRANDAGFSVVHGAFTSGVWSSWINAGEYVVDYLGRADGQALMISAFEASLYLQNTNSSTVAGCDMQLELIRTDDETLIGRFVDTIYAAATWGGDWTFTMPTSPSPLFYTYTADATMNTEATVAHTPWNALHGKPGGLNLLDANPPNGLATYRLRWRLRPGASGITSMSQRVGAGAITVIGGKA